MTKKAFKELCYDTVYTGWNGRRIKKNAFFYDYALNGYKYMVWSENITKKELFNSFYNWIEKRIVLPWNVYSRHAETDEKRFKVPISL